MLGMLETFLLHISNAVAYVVAFALAISDNIGAALIAAVASVANTALIVGISRRSKATQEDIKRRRLVVVKYNEGDEETVVITPEERRALEDLRHLPED